VPIVRNLEDGARAGELGVRPASWPLFAQSGRRECRLRANRIPPFWAPGRRFVDDD